METLLRAALIDWLRGDPALSTNLNAIVEEAPARATAPWLGLVASSSADWSTKDRTGREVRVALELHFRGDEPTTGSDLTVALENRVRALPHEQAGFAIVTATFLRARVERRAANTRAALLEYRFLLLAD